MLFVPFEKLEVIAGQLGLYPWEASLPTATHLWSLQTSVSLTLLIRLLHTHTQNSSILSRPWNQELQLSSICQKISVRSLLYWKLWSKEILSPAQFWSMNKRTSLFRQIKLQVIFRTLWKIKEMGQGDSLFGLLPLLSWLQDVEAYVYASSSLVYAEHFAYPLQPEW